MSTDIGVSSPHRTAGPHTNTNGAQPPPPAMAPPPARPASRDDQVRAAMKDWRRQLMSLDGRNNLVAFRPLKVGTLSLHDADPAAVAALGAGRKVRISQLFPDEDALPDALKRAGAIGARAKSNEEERGVYTARIGAGFVRWQSHDGKDRRSPLLLQPVTIEATDRTRSDFQLTTDPVDAPVELNPLLAELLRVEAGVRIPLDRLNEELQDTRLSLDTAATWWEANRGIFTGLRGHRLDHEMHMGNFSYMKLPMVADLEAAEELAVGHDLVAALAGVDAARDAVGRVGAEADPQLPDRGAPADEYLILDADSSQSQAINSVVTGRNLIVQGPPGTGKSQTIANLIATLTARGKKVLFVAEKRAAIEAVTRRLDSVGLGDLVLDLHDDRTSRRVVQKRLRDAFESAREAEPADHRRGPLETARAKVIAAHDATHRLRHPAGVSVRWMVVELARVEPFRTDHRLSGPTDSLVQDRIDELAEHAAELAELGGFDTFPQSPWAQARLESEEQARTAYQEAQRLAATDLPAVRGELDGLLAATGLPRPRTLTDWTDLFALLGGLAATLAVFQPAIFDEDPSLLAAATGGRRYRRDRDVELRWRQRRALRKSARELLRPDAPPQNLHAALVDAAARLAEWQRLAQGRPVLPGGWNDTLSRFDDVRARLAALGALVGSQLDAQADEQVQRAASALADDPQHAMRAPRITHLRTLLDEAGLSGLLGELRTAHADASVARGRTRYAIVARLLEDVQFTDRTLQGASGKVWDQHVSAYRTADRAHIRDNAPRVKRLVAENLYAAREQFRDQDSRLQSEINKKSRLKPLRELVAANTDMLFAYNPCWAMSPLVVSQTLPQRQLFDVVIFDEASQVLPQDAVPALLRGKQAVVAGDTRQLPPTTFFVGGENEDDVEDQGAPTKDYESVLSALAGILPSSDLRWHYRSQDERLIAVSNAEVYDGRLVTFSGARGEDCLRFEHTVPSAAEGGPGAVAHEVERVVDLMVEHAGSFPDESLGVVTLNVAHRDLIENALLRRLGELPEELADFFDESRPEPVFVKNIERVQGDERDAIIIATGYQKDASGRLAQRFGPINFQGGERRLNVAASRARRRMALVSSFTSSDIVPTAENGGRQMLRALFQFMESGGKLAGERMRPDIELNPFEAAVLRRLRGAGLTVEPQYGVSRYVIDFAVRHPDKPGLFVLAIEADGATYHSSPTARDRDRLRQEHLERLGWRFHRIWSTSWFNDPDGETQRAVAAYRAALESVAEDATPVLPPPAVVRPRPQTARGRGPKPRIRQAEPITTYSDHELHELLRWVESDGRLRTQGELLDEMVRALGYRRRGARIRQRLEGVIARHRG